MHELIIIGGGPAGLTAGIYAQRARMDAILLERLSPGGQVALTDIVENYPGFPEIQGFELIRRFEEHARKFGLRIESGKEVTKVELEGDVKRVYCGDEVYEALSLIIATGAKPKKLGVKGEEEFTGRGVSYCATCDGFFYRDKVVCVLGGGDTAVSEALYLSKLASKVYLIHRRDRLRAAKILQERAMQRENIEFIWNSTVEEIRGDDKVTSVLLRNLRSGETRELPVDGVFIFVGTHPNTEFIDVEKDENGFIITDEMLRTSAEGVFAAGDCRKKPLRQISTAVGDGALAVYSAEKYLEERK
ncbi:MAG: thioredoxin reductase [Archaeoglobi archaeon]|nr:thioredoxin reductase [Archaeoglobi archaeon]MDK2781576.1 thioredoxin reductase [Archaeoglobi archaeon]